MTGLTYIISLHNDFTINLTVKLAARFLKTAKYDGRRKFLSMA